MVKKLLCILLSVLMILSILPVGVVADTEVTTVTYTFSDVEQNTSILNWGYSGVTISDAGALTVTLTGSSNGGGIAFDLPSGIDVTTITTIAFNFEDFSDYTYLEIDLYVDGTVVASKYGSTSADWSSYTSKLTTSNVVSFVIKNNTYNADADNAIARTWTVSSFSVTAVQETSGDTGNVGETETYYLIENGTSVAGSTFNSGTISFGSTIVTSSNTTFMDMVTRDDAVITIEYTVTGNDSNGGYWNIFQFVSSDDSDHNDWISITSYSSASYGASTMTDTLNGTVMGSQWSLITTGSHVVTYSAANLIAYYEANKTDHTFETDFTELKSQSGLSDGATISITSMYITASATSGGDEPGETTDYTFPIEGHAYGNGSSAYDTTTGVVTFENAWTSCIGWYFGESSTIKLESLTITFAEAVPNYMQLVVVYCSGQKDSSVGIGSGTTVTISAGEYSSDNNNVIDASECIKQIYLQSSTAGSSVTIASVTYTLATETLPTFYGRALTLDGEIGVTYYFNMTGVENVDDYVLSASIGGATAKDYSLGSTVDIDGKTYYRYTVYVLPTQLTSTIKAKLTDGTNEVEVSEYSVSIYCKRAIGYAADGDTDWDDTADLCKQVLNYGYYLDLWLHSGTSTSGIDIAEDYDSTWTDPVTGTLDVTFDEKYDSTSDDVKKTLALDGKGIYIRVYVSDNTAGYTVSGKTLETSTDSNGQYIEFKVATDEMADIFTVCNADGTTYTTYSIYSYIKNNVSNSNEYLVKLCKAIYYYCEAALNYAWV
ncbi:MAG: hypothetical protein LUG86_01250 [Oscillospiraceae bacterium]|nr:hypothetical protein [Oscillospiraceae bacterium]